MTLSPRQLALAIGVSESSLKRWADAGKLHVSRTDGGHRRIAVSEAVRFIRDAGMTVVRPDILGLDRTRRAPGKTPETDARVIRAHLVGRFLAGESIAMLADGPIAEALARLDALHDRDAHAAKHVLLARVATDAWTQAIAALRALCDVPTSAPLAVGGARAPTGALRSATVAAVFAGEGFRAIDLGADLDADVLRAAVAAHKPALTWLLDGATVDVSGYRLRTLSEAAAFARGLRSRT